jgi:PAS domain S-box-containing protein
MHGDNESTVTGKLLLSRLSLSLYSLWPQIAVVLVIVHLPMRLMLRQGIALDAYSISLDFSLLALACGLCALNAVQSRQAVRLFWSFLAVANLLWAFSQCLWFYFHVLKGRTLPPFLAITSVLFLHTVFQIAAVATRPHLKLAGDRRFRALLSFLTLLFLWVFIYAYLVYAREFPREHDVRTFVPGFQIPYSAENLFLLVLLGRLVFSSLPPWKSIYGYLLLGSTLYAAESLLFNMSYFFGSGPSNLRSLLDPAFTASVCCFVWAALQGQKMAHELERTVRIDNTGSRRVSILAMLAVLAIPLVGLFELFRGNEPDLTRVIRLAIVLMSMLVLGLVTFIGYILANRELVSDTITVRKVAESALRESEERFRVMANTTPSLIWMCDEGGKITYLNDRRIAFTGRDPRAGYDDTWTTYIHPDDRKQVQGAFSWALKGHQPFSMEYRLRHRDGVYRWMFDVAAPRVNGDGSFAGFIGSAIDITDQKLAQEALQNIGGRLLEAQEEERRRIARELHDDISQKLALLSMELAQANRSANGSVEATKERLNEIRQHCSGIAKDIQSLSHQLHYSKLDYLGLAGALKGFCREFAKQYDVSIDFKDQNVPRQLPRNISLCLFRVAQEALHNAVKYSGTREYTLRLSAAADEVQLVVSDAGAGFDVEEAMRSRGLGLVSMHERVHLVQGRFNVESRPGEGTTIVATVPG